MVVVAPVAGILIALLCVLLAWALVQFAQVVGRLLPDWHIPGFGSLRGTVTNAAAAAEAGIKSAVQSAARPLAQFILAPIIVLRTLFDRLGDNVVAATSALVGITGHLIPAWVTTLRTAITSARTQAFAHADQAVAGLAHTVGADVANLMHAIDSAEATLLADLSRTRAELVALIGSDVSTLHADLVRVSQALQHNIDASFGNSLSLLRSVQASLTAAISAAESRAVNLAHGLVNAAVSELDKAIDVAKAAVLAEVDALAHGVCLPLWPSVTAGIDAIDKAAAGAFTDTLQGLRAIPRDIPTTLPLALSGVVSVVTALERFTADCTIPNCKNLSGFGRDLQALFGLVEDGVIVALLVEAARDPQGTAHAVHNMIGTPIEASVHAIGALAGVA